MKFLKTILDFYINTSIHVAIAVFSLVQISKLQLNISTNVNVECFIFSGTILGYNFLKYFEVFWKRIFTFNKNLGIVLVSLSAIFGMLFYFFRLEFSFQLEFFKIGILILIYPFIRKYGLIKMVFVSFCMTLITVYIPIMNETQNWIYLIQRFLIVFCLLIPLEICDFETDSKTIETLPKIIGIQNLKILGYFLLLIFCLLKLKFDIDIVIAIFIAIAIFFSDENRSKYYTSFWVEAIPIICYLYIDYF